MRSAAHARRLRQVLRRAAVLAIPVLLGGLLLPAAVPAARAATCGPANLALNQPATASSTENASFPTSSAVDGNTGTRWSSAFSDPQWLEVDLGSSQAICQVTLTWETAYATAFQIQVSPDGSTWTSIYSTTTGTGGTQTLPVSGTGRYIRMYGTARATQYGYSLWEFGVYGTGSGSTTCGTADAALNQPATASSTENVSFPASSAVDGNTGTRWSSAFSDPQWLEVDLGSSQAICQVTLTWETAYATAFQIQVSPDGSTWTTIYSTTTGTGGTQTLPVSGTGRYIRMYGTARATPYGYSLWEFGVYTTGGSGSGGGGGGTGGNGTCPWVNSTAPVATRVSEVIAQMTLAQKISLLHGNGNASPYIGNVTGIPSLCIPSLGLQDGPAGVGDGLGGVTQMPSGNASAATFDPSYEQQYGAAIGAEFAGKGANVALGPTVNIVRDPRWGRAFETFGEDPYLSGQMAAADIRGIQSQGVMAEVKHAAVYNIENPAGTVIVDPRTLQEIYLPAFQAAIAQSAPAAVMCAYSVVNSVPACQNPALLNTGLYQQAGFGGFITSDWGGTHSTVDSVNAGLTMEMPNGYFYADLLSQAVAAGQVSTATIDTMVSRVLTQMFAFGLFDKAPSGSTTATVTTAAHAQVALQGAEEGTVLLKNNGLLPLSASSLSSIAVIGVDGGAGTQTIGGGSATVTSPGTVWPLTGIQNRVAGTGVTVTYNDGTNQASAVSLAQNSSVAVVFASDNYGNEEHDTTTLNLPNSQDALISAVAAANPHTIVVLNDNSAILMPWLNQVAGVFEGFYDGQEWGTAIAALLFGDADPSGKLPMTFPASLTALPASTAAQWPGTNGQISYSEGLDVGYRWYDAQNVTPLFPFGYGLSYTSFSYSNLHAGTLSNGQATVTATVTNTGSRAGTDVAQLYVGDPASAGEPPHQLKGFQRVTLNPGASATVTFTVTAYDLAHWDTASGTWLASAGSYQILVGDSSRSLPLSGTLSVPAAITTSVQSPDGVAGAASTAQAVAPAAGSSPASAGRQQTPAPLAGQVTITSPGGMQSRRGVPARLQIKGSAGLTYRATGLPPGLAISPAGLITGTGRTPGTRTVTVTGTSASGATAATTFVWTISPSSS
jgi:beta-glucosidase